MGIFNRLRDVAVGAINSGLDHAQTADQKQKSRADELHDLLAGIENDIHAEERELGELQQQQQTLTGQMTTAQEHLHSVQEAVDADPSKWSDQDHEAIDKAVGACDTIDQQLTRINNRITELNKSLHDHYQDYNREKAAVDAEYEKVGHIHDTEVATQIEKQSADFGKRQEDLKRKLAEGDDPEAQAAGELAAAKGEHAAHGGLNDTERRAEQNDEAKRRAALLAKYGKPAAATTTATK